MQVCASAVCSRSSRYQELVEASIVYASITVSQSCYCCCGNNFIHTLLSTPSVIALKYTDNPLVSMQTTMQARLSSRAPAFTAVRPVRCIVSRSTAVVVRSSAVSAPAMLPVKSVEGEDKGTQQMALKVAGESGKGLVHRYLVMVQQNARQVGLDAG